MYSHPEFAGNGHACTGTAGAQLALGGRSTQDVSRCLGRTWQMNRWTAGESRGGFPVV